MRFSRHMFQKARMDARVAGLLMLIVALPVGAVADGPYTILDGSHLCQIDLPTGAISIVGPISTAAHCLVFLDDGFLYGINVYDDVLVRFDPGTGASTVIGPLGVDLVNDLGVDCTVDDSGQMWLLDHHSLYSVHASTGAATRVCEQSNPDVHLIGLEAAAGTMYTNVEWPTTPVNLDCGLTELGIQGDWIDSGPENRLYAIDLVVSPWTWESDSFLYLFDPATGTSEPVATVENAELIGLAFPQRLQQPAAVPALRSGSAILLVLLLGLAAVLLIRRS